MTEMFPGQCPAGYQEQKTPKTEHLADGEFQANGLPAVNPEALQEEKGRLSRGMGGSALEASGVASPESDRSEAVSQDSSDPPRTLSPAEELRARLAGFQPDKKETTSPEDPDKARADLLAALRGGGKESPDASSQPSEKAVKTGESNDQSEANTQGDEQQPEMNSEQLRELIDNCLRAAQSAREDLNKAMQSIDMAGNMSLDGFQAGLSFADGNLNQVGNAAQVLEKIAPQNKIDLLGNSVNEVQLRIRSLDADVRSGENVDRGYLSRLLERVDEMVRFVAELRDRQDQDRREQAEEGDDSSLD
jgi:hypothetical protein